MNGTKFGTPVNILLVEDNPGDVDLIRESIEKSTLHCTLSVAVNGEAAMRFLRKTGKDADSPRPDLVLLDLNLPKKSGHDVLAEIKADSTLRQIAVMVLTSSQDEEDKFRSYGSHAYSYVKKPASVDQMPQVVEAIEKVLRAQVPL